MRSTCAMFLIVCTAPLFAQEDLHGQDLEGKSLKGRNLKAADLRETNFTDADLTGADLTGAKLDKTDFRGTDLTRAILRGLDLSKALTRDTCLRAADLRDTRGLSDITDLDFTDADLRGADLSAARDYRDGSARFKGARYDAATKWPKGTDPVKAGAKLEGSAKPKDPPPVPNDPPVIPKDPPRQPPPAKPEPGMGRDLRKKDFSGRDLRAEDLKGANLQGAKLWGVDLRSVDLSYASFKGADLTSANLDGADLTGADFRDAILNEVSLNGAKLVEADLRNVDLRKAKDIIDAVFRGADLRGLKGLPEYNTGGNDWRDADLRGAYIAGPLAGKFQNARFRRAKYDKATVWPAGLDLDSLGLELVETVAVADEIPPKLFAPDHDWSAPSEERVKKLFELQEFSEKYGRDPRKPGNQPKEIPAGQLMVIRLSRMEYARSCKGIVIPSGMTKEQMEALDPKTLPHRVIYSIHVAGESTWTDAHGGHVKTEIDEEVGFYKNDEGNWECQQKGLFVLFK